MGVVEHWEGWSIGRGGALGGVEDWEGWSIGRGGTLGGVEHWEGGALGGWSIGRGGALLPMLYPSNVSDVLSSGWAVWLIRLP